MIADNRCNALFIVLYALAAEVGMEAGEYGDGAPVVEDEYVRYGICGVFFRRLRGYASLDVAAAESVAAHYTLDARLDGRRHAQFAVDIVAEPARIEDCRLDEYPVAV